MDSAVFMWLLIGACGGLAGFWTGYFFSPAARTINALKEQVSYWQGMYSSMKRRLNESEGAEPQDGIAKLLGNPLVQMVLPHIAQRLGLPKEVIDALIAGKMPNLASAAKNEKTDSDQKTITVWQ